MVFSKMARWIAKITYSFSYSAAKTVFVVAYGKENLSSEARGAAYAVALSGGNVALRLSPEKDALEKSIYLGAEGVFYLSENPEGITVEYFAHGEEGRAYQIGTFPRCAEEGVGLITAF